MARLTQEEVQSLKDKLTEITDASAMLAARSLEAKMALEVLGDVQADYDAKVALEDDAKDELTALENEFETLVDSFLAS